MAPVAVCGARRRHTAPGGDTRVDTRLTGPSLKSRWLGLWPGYRKPAAWPRGSDSWLLQAVAGATTGPGRPAGLIHRPRLWHVRKSALPNKDSDV